MHNSSWWYLVPFLSLSCGFLGIAVTTHGDYLSYKKKLISVFVLWRNLAVVWLSFAQNLFFFQRKIAIF